MCFPRFPEKFTQEPFFNPQDFLGSMPDSTPPRGVILAYQSSLAAYVVEACSTRPAGKYFGDKVRYIDDDWAGGGCVALASCFSVSDTLAELAWRPEFHAQSTREGLQKLMHAAIGALNPVLSRRESFP